MIEVKDLNDVPEKYRADYIEVEKDGVKIFQHKKIFNGHWCDETQRRRTRHLSQRIKATNRKKPSEQPKLKKALEKAKGRR